MANADEGYKFRGAAREPTLIQKVPIEVVVDVISLDAIITVIEEGGRSSGGAGKIFVTSRTTV